jgi:CRISPR-associated protein Cas2
VYILVTYDIAVTSPSGPKRLRKVSETCSDYGQRVQNSVFECDVNENQMTEFEHRLEQLINPTVDSIRIYRLIGQSRDEIIHMGIKEPTDFQDPLIF